MARTRSTISTVRDDLLLAIFLDYDDPFCNMREIFARFKQQHREAWIAEGEEGDWGQKFRNAVGRALQTLVQYLVEDSVSALNRDYDLGLLCTTDSELNKTNPTPPLDRVKRNLLIDYGEYGCHLPDADVVVFRKENNAVVCVVSCKTSLRDRMKQTVYWKLKLQQSPITTHVRYSLVTLDNDGVLLAPRQPYNMNYGIANVDLDATYVLREDLTPYDRIKRFSSFESDLRSWLGGGGGGGRCLLTSPGKPSTLPNSINGRWKLARRSERIDAVRRCSPIPMSLTKTPRRTSLRLGSGCGRSNAS